MNTRSRTVLPPRTEQGSIMIALMLSIALILLSFVAASVLVTRNTQTRLTNSSQQSQTGIDAGTAFAIDRIHGLPARTCMGLPQTIPASWQNTASTDGGMFRWWADCSELAKGKITATVEAQTADTKFTNPKLAQLCFTWIPNKGYKITCRVSSDAHTPVPPPTPPPNCSAVPQQTLDFPPGSLKQSNHNNGVIYSSSGQLYIVSNHRTTNEYNTAGTSDIYRYNSDYTRDNTWTFSRTGWYESHVLPLRNGNTLIYGRGFPETYADAKIVDPSGNPTGIQITMGAAYFEGPATEAPDGSLYLSVAPNGNNIHAVHKYSASGVEDPLYTAIWTAAVNADPAFWTAPSSIIAIPTGPQAGQLVVAGVLNGSSPLFARFNPDGTLNRSFSAPATQWIQGLVWEEDTNRVTATFARSSLSDWTLMGIMRVNPDGKYDESFNKGVNPSYFGPVSPSARSLGGLARDEFGRYYIAGMWDSSSPLGPLRYNGVSINGSGVLPPPPASVETFTPLLVVNSDGTFDYGWNTNIYNDCTRSTRGFIKTASGGLPWALAFASNPQGTGFTLIADSVSTYNGLKAVASNLNTSSSYLRGIYIFKSDGVSIKVGS